MNKSTREEMRMFQSIDRCKCGKPIYDKKGAQTAKNLRMRRDHVELRIYSCPESNGGWHLTKQLRRSR